METFVLTMDAKGRTSWPQSLREQAHLHPGDTLVARVTGEGQVVVETRDAVKQRMRRRAARGRERTDTTESLSESLLADRRADRSLR